MSVFVTLGNTNLGTFRNVCLAVREVYPEEEIDTLLIVDTPESVKEQYESERNHGIREIMPGAEIRSRTVEAGEVQTTLPLAVARLLGEVGPEQIIIDLTNGLKSHTGVLYAVASISKIERIHSLQIKDRDNLGKDLSKLRRPDDWEYVVLEPLKEIDTIARHSFLELLYYQEELKAVGRALGEQSSDFAQDSMRLTNQALEDYFRAGADVERYKLAVATLGIVCEEIARTLYRYCRQSKKLGKGASSFAGYVDQIGSQIKPLRSRTVDWEEHGHFGQQMLRILPIDLLLQVAVFLRNQAAHPTVYQCRREEARLMLAITLLMLKRIGETDVLRVR